MANRIDTLANRLMPEMKGKKKENKDESFVDVGNHRDQCKRDDGCEEKDDVDFVEPFHMRYSVADYKLILRYSLIIWNLH